MKHTIDNWEDRVAIRRVVVYTADPDAMEDGMEPRDILSLLGIRDLQPGC